MDSPGRRRKNEVPGGTPCHCGCDPDLQFCDQIRAVRRHFNSSN